ncbi:MAG: hypothetical protein VYB35_12460 [Verrucomicrobiota bacterium]|nr:hypothetical protein [Verrucomicrobiota bacterium]
MKKGRATGMSLFSFQDIIMSVMGILLLITLLLTLFLVTPSEASFGKGKIIGQLEAQLVTAEKNGEDLESAISSLQIAISQMATAPNTNQLLAELALTKKSLTSKSNELIQLEQKVVKAQEAQEKEIEKLGLNKLKQQVEDLQVKSESLKISSSQQEAAIEQQKQQIQAIQENLNTLIKDANKLWLIPSLEKGGREPIIVTVSGSGIEIDRFNRPEDKKKFPENRSLEALNMELKPLSPAKDYVLFYIRPSGVDLYAKLKDLATDKGLQVGSDAVGEKTEMEFTRDLEE